MDGRLSHGQPTYCRYYYHRSTLHYLLAIMATLPVSRAAGKHILGQPG